MPNKKDEVVRIRLTKQEKQQLLNNADKLEMNLSQYLRFLIKNSKGKK